MGEIEGCKSWLVAVGCCIINCFLLSAFRLAGLIYVALIERYDTDRSTASVPLFIFFFFKSIGGIPVAAIGQKIGLEETVILGSVIASVGFGATYFAETMTAVIIFFGIIYGSGLAIGIVFLSNILRKHFSKSFNTASGIYNAGSCIGAFIFPPIALYLLDIYGISGTFLIVSGIMLHSLPVAMLLRLARNEPKPRSKIHVTVTKKMENGIKEPCLTNVIKMDTSVVVESEENLKKNLLEVQAGYQIQLKCSNGEKIIEDSSLNEETEIFIKKDIDNIKTTIIDKPDSSDLKSSEISYKKDSNQKEQVTFLKSLSVLREPSFLIISFVIAFLKYALTVVWTTFIDYSRDKGIAKENEVFLLMFSPLFDIFGRLGLVWIVDKGFMSYTTFTSIGYLVMAASVTCITLSKTFEVFVVGTLFFGLSTGALFVITTNLIFEFVEKEKHIMAISCRSLIYAPMCFTSAPLIEYFRGNLKSYDGLYCIVIITCVLSSLITPLAARFSKVEKHRKENSKKQDETSS